jgi:hypothetical protein
LIERIGDVMEPGSPAVVEARKAPTFGTAEDVTQWVSGLDVADLKAEIKTMTENYIRGQLEEWAGDVATDIEAAVEAKFDADSEAAGDWVQIALKKPEVKAAIKAKAVEILKAHLGDLLRGKIAVGYPYK